MEGKTMRPAAELGLAAYRRYALCDTKKIGSIPRSRGATTDGSLFIRPGAGLVWLSCLKFYILHRPSSLLAWRLVVAWLLVGRVLCVL